MPDYTKSPFAGLPSSFVVKILSDCTSLTGEITGPVRQVLNERESIRDRLREKNLLNTVDIGSAAAAATVCGIDGWCGIERMLASDLMCAAVFSMAGLAENRESAVSPESGDTGFRLDVFPDGVFTGAYGLLRALLAQRKAELAASSPDGIVLLRGSCVKLFAAMMNGLQPAMRNRDTLTAKTFVAGLKASVAAFDNIARADTGKICAGMPADDRGGELLDVLGTSTPLRQSCILTVLVGEGEYAGPVKIDSSDLEAVKNLQIKDRAFSDIRDRIVDSLSRYHVLYYRPNAWTSALRIEVADSIAGNPENLQGFLAAVHGQCLTTGLSTPFPLYRAGKATSNFKNSSPALRSIALSKIASEFGDTLGDVLPHLKENDSNTGDDNE